MSVGRGSLLLAREGVGIGRTPGLLGKLRAVDDAAKLVEQRAKGKPCILLPDLKWNSSATIKNNKQKQLLTVTILTHRQSTHSDQIILHVYPSNPPSMAVRKDWGLKFVALLPDLHRW